MSKLSSAIIDLIRMRTQSGDPVTPPGGFGYFFEKLSKPFYINSNGDVFDLTQGSAIATPASQIIEASGPTTLGIGIVNDGEYLKRSGEYIVGVSTPTGSTVGYVLLRDEKAPGTGGGTSNVGWQARDINTEVADTGNLCSFDGIFIVLEPGTYRYEISAPAFEAGRHKVFLYNNTLGDWVIGSNGTLESSSYDQTRSVDKGVFTILEQSSFEIDHYTEESTLEFGLGLALNGDWNEVFTVAEFWKIA